MVGTKEREVIMGAREEILERLRQVKQPLLPPRPVLPPLREFSFSKEELLERLIDELTKQEAIVQRVESAKEVKAKLRSVLEEEGITKVIVSTDEVVKPFDFPGAGREWGISIRPHTDFTDRDQFKKVVFEEVQAGLTGVNFAVAESGTLGIIHDEQEPRLISLAPIAHIALVPTDRVVPTYEVATDEVFKNGQRIPSQFTFITGPSMTADIKATPFKGMHGPRRLIVIIFDSPEEAKG
jgi:L-lactate dehydrogenase complex protein LldG